MRNRFLITWRNLSGKLFYSICNSTMLGLRRKYICNHRKRSNVVMRLGSWSETDFLLFFSLPDVSRIYMYVGTCLNFQFEEFLSPCTYCMRGYYVYYTVGNAVVKKISNFIFSGIEQRDWNSTLNRKNKIYIISYLSW